MIPVGHKEFVSQLASDNNIPPPTGDEPRPTSDETLTPARRSLEILFEEEVKIFASGLGSPAFILDRCHEAGTMVWRLVGLPRQAQRQVDAGVDVVIAQGYNSGGHSGTVGTFTLVPEVVRMAEGTNTMIVAAGGINNGRQLAAALTIGAVGIWTGTIWLATHESETEMFRAATVEQR